MQHKTSASIADELAARMRTDTFFRVPAIRTLARQTGVAYPTAWRAVRILAEMGLVHTRPGRSATKTGEEENADSACARVSASLRNQILGAKLRSGDRLPKLDFLSAEHDASRPTVIAALHRLAGEHLTHRKRHRWYAGPAPLPESEHIVNYSADSPTVVLYLAVSQLWYASFENAFLNRFLLPFWDELAKHRFRLTPVLKYPPQQGMGAGMPVGIEGVRATVKSLGSRYQGTLAIDNWPKQNALDEAIAEFGRSREPVVYLDSIDVGGYLTRPGLGLRQYYRLHLDERGAVRSALSELARLGHRTVCVHGSEVFDWSRARITLIREIAAAMSPPMDVAVCPPTEEAWKFPMPGALNELVTGVLGPGWEGGALITRRDRRKLLHASASLTATLARSGATAIVALNDKMAREYHSLFRVLGVGVPEDISIISFDNAPEAVFFPISTIDFGFAQLGYLAAHILIGDIPVSAGRDGHVGGKCVIMNRGTLGPPGDPAKLTRALS